MGSRSRWQNTLGDGTERIATPIWELIQTAQGVTSATVLDLRGTECRAQVWIWPVAQAEFTHPAIELEELQTIDADGTWSFNIDHQRSDPQSATD